MNGSLYGIDKYRDPILAPWRDVIMKINKKYIPKIHKKLNFDSGADGTFPIFLPKYSPLEKKELTRLQYQESMVRNLYQFTGKQYHPCYFTWLQTTSYEQKMKGKEALPYFAKVQRLEQLANKQTSKSQRWIEQLFSDIEAKRIDFDVNLHAQMQSVFDLIWAHHLLKKAPRLVYRDISNQSIVNEDDIEWRSEEQYLLEVKCFVETKNEVLPLLVTDLLSFFSDVGVVVHSNDKRYKKHIGKNIIIPIINKSIPIFGEEGVDTIKDNGIVRINPLLSFHSLQKTQQYWLNQNENFIDEKGIFTKGLQHFSGQSIFDFEENIVETLDTIWNLASKKKQTMPVPYSKYTGQRLIKRVLPLRYIDIGALEQERKDWVSQYYPVLVKYTENLEVLHLPLESQANFVPKMMVDSTTQYLWFLAIKYDWELSVSPLEWMLAYLFWWGYIEPKVSLNTIIDTLYLVPESFWEQAMGVLWSQQTAYRAFIYDLKAQPVEQLLTLLLAESEQIERVERDEKTQELTLQLPKYCDPQRYERWVFDEWFLRAAALVAYAQNTGYQQVLFAPYDSNFILTVLLLLYLADKKEGFLFVSELPELKYQHPIAEKTEILAKSYGRDTLRLLWAKQLPQEEKHLEDCAGYLQHFRNLFKLLYERWALSHSEDMEYEILPLDLRIYSQWEEVWEYYRRYQETGQGFANLIDMIQNFTKEQYTWYLEFLKKDVKQASNQVAMTIFIEILQILTPLLPNLKHEIEEYLGYTISPKLHQHYEGKKDYKVHLLFDMIKGIHQKKQEIWLKKHHPITLAIKANTEILKLVQDNQIVFDALLRTQELLPIQANEQLPSDFSDFTILDIQIGIQAYQEQGVRDDLSLWEKQYQDKLQQLEYLRSTLMMLSSNPLIPRDKIELKEQEMYQLKEEIDILEIKIKKLKIQRKSA